MKPYKLLSTTIALTTLLFCFSFFSDASSVLPNITRKSVKIAGKSSNLVYIKTGTGRTGELTIGTGRFYTSDTAQNHINRKNAEKGKSVVVAVNGGYFDAYTSDLRTYATIIQNGVLMNAGGGGKLPTLGFTSTGEALIDRVEVKSKVILRSTIKVYPWQVNVWYTDPGAIMMFNSCMGRTLKIPAASTLVYIKNNMVSKVIANTATSLGKIPVDTIVLVYNKSAYSNAKKYGNDPKAGNSAVVTTEITPGKAKNSSKWSKIINAVSAGPMIILDKKDVSGQNTDFTEVKQSSSFVALRAFAAIMSDGRLLLGTATTSPKQLASYLRSIGAVDALSLDGGASTMMYIKGSGFVVPAGRKLSNVLSIIEYSTGKLPSAKQAVDLETPSSWAQADIKEADAIGLIPSNIKGAYKTNITRQEFCNLSMQLVTTVLGGDKVKVLLNKTGISYDTARSTFTDAYHIDILNCYRLNIVANNNHGIFDPNTSVTRQEAALMTGKICGIIGVDTAVQEQIISDVEKNASGLGGTSNLSGYFSRQEAVAITLRLYNKATGK